MKFEAIKKRSSVFLITRFNLNLYAKDKDNQPTRTEKWLRDRFFLFEKYCMSSVSVQSYKDFIWLVLFDDNTPIAYKQKINLFREKLDLFLPVYFCDKETDQYAELLKTIILEHKDDKPYLITTRVDNDDAIHKDFIKTLVELETKQPEKECIYTFKYGIQYYTEANLAVKLPYIRNHWPALIITNYTKNDDFKHINQFNHYYLAYSGIFYKCINNPFPLWVEVIHGNNVINDIIFTLDLTIIKGRNYLTSNFGWDVELNDDTSVKRKYTFLLPRFIQQFIKRGAKRIVSEIMKLINR